MYPTNLPFGAEIDNDGVWRQLLTRLNGTERRPALFLDRDGVIVEEAHYLREVKDMDLIDGAADVIRLANTNGIPVVVVTNQAGIGRGILNWDQFINVQEAMLDALADLGAYVNAVFACPHHGDGHAPYNVKNHPARKPNPGMLHAASEMMPIICEGSWIIGDHAGDIGAAKNAGCDGGVHVLSGHGPEERKGAAAYKTVTFDVKHANSIKDAGPMIPLLNMKK